MQVMPPPTLVTAWPRAASLEATPHDLLDLAGALADGTGDSTVGQHHEEDSTCTLNKAHFS
jgi:hypothetical protein